MTARKDLNHKDCPTCLRAQAQMLIDRAERIEKRLYNRTTMNDFEHALEEYDEARSVWLKIPQGEYNKRRAAGEADNDFPEHVAYRAARANLKATARCLEGEAL